MRSILFLTFFCIPVLSFAKDDLNNANYPLKAHVQETGLDDKGSNSVSGSPSTPLSSGGQSTVEKELHFMSMAILKISDGQTYRIHGEQAQFLRLDKDYACRITGKKNNKLEILGQDGKGHWHEWKVTIDKVTQ